MTVATTSSQQVLASASSDRIKVNVGEDSVGACVPAASKVSASVQAGFGATGLQGIQGIQGIQGERGPQGERGEKGDTGERGPQGIQGVQGETGPQGERGEKGDTGDRGPQGIQGVQGETGPQGERGLQGERGEQGIQGPAGGIATIAEAADVLIASVQPGDVLRYDSGRWRNYADIGLTDGGNF